MNFVQEKNRAPSGMRIGIDNYGLMPMGWDPLHIMKWAKGNGADGVQFSGLDPKSRETLDEAYLKDLVQYAEAEAMYIEWGGGQHIPYDTTTWQPSDIFEINRKAVEEAVQLNSNIIRSCSGGLFRWFDESPSTEILLEKSAESLKAQASLFRDHGCVLAIETHFEFTTFELLRLFEMCDVNPGDYLGLCLDTMNLLTMLEDPVLATERVLPWVVSTHLKDGGLMLNAQGLHSFPTALGEGVIDLKSIVQLLSTLDYEVTLSIESHGGGFDLPINDPVFLSRFPDLTVEETVRLMALVQKTQDKLETGSCVQTERDAWPHICEQRVKADVETLIRWRENGFK